MEVLKRLICRLFGHDWQRLEYNEYGPSIEGWVSCIAIEQCKRCHKRRESRDAYKV
jgi:hypothetical protein